MIKDLEIIILMINILRKHLNYFEFMLTVSIKIYDDTFGHAINT